MKVPADVYFAWKYFSFTVTIHLAESGTFFKDPVYSVPSIN